MIKITLYLSLFVLCLASFLIAGCSSGLSPFISESWSENYALAFNNANASPPEINDGNLMTLAITEPPNREYIITLPEIKKINRVVIYSGNVISYDLFCLDNKTNKWIRVGGVGKSGGMQKVYEDKQQLLIPRFDHRINFTTDKIKLIVNRAERDGIVTTRTPGKTDKIINYRTDYIQMGNNRVRVDLYDVFMFTKATIREIEVYSHVKKPKNK